MKDGKKSSGRMAGALLAGMLAKVPLRRLNAQYGASRSAGGRRHGSGQAADRRVQRILGRVEATNRVNIVARVTAFLEKREFADGAEVRKGDLLYELERGPFEADLKSRQAQVAQLQATLVNAKLTTNRAKTLLSGPAGQQSTYDAALATQQSLEAQSSGRSGAGRPVADQSRLYPYPLSDRWQDRSHHRDRGQRGHPGSGTLASIVSQDPMYVTFPVSVREGRQLRDHYATRGGFKAVVIRLRLSDGRLYDQVGQLNFVNNTIAQNTDTHAAGNHSQSNLKELARQTDRYASSLTTNS